ncbi:hypothetical protein EVAR_19217_1 [Eumeta japonica]|uniref:Reverse transcriptase/retrotransposon-derived protein RNase H-like domain-containing protein n=1 Tax=Eumeta variegata TaxID=151549 RepID=A0A4C1VD78_EUMVA|nr:hypothetical protein EVAR_19217_1 [Eumeta japonica]
MQPIPDSHAKEAMEVTALGYEVSEGGVKPSKKKLDAVLELKIDDREKFEFIPRGKTLGASLMQGEKELREMYPVAYASQKLSNLEKTYSTTEREC